MKKTDVFFLTAFVIAIITNVSSSYIDKKFPDFGKYTSYLIGCSLFLWGVYRLAELVFAYIRYGRYAVLIFFLNNNNQLLVIKHPFHGCLLPVGGRLKQWELPHLAVKRKLKEEAGIGDFMFHPEFHDEQLMISEIVENVPRPYSVHMEHRTQRGIAKYHYAFVYVCRFKGGDENIDIQNEHQPSWKSLEQLQRMPRQVRPFDDIIIRYEDILNQLLL
jgi:ADP-ribose pyrophosphatase YjhB (NUDIX family)